MPDHLGDETPPTTPRTDTSTGRKGRSQHSAPTAEEWRELLLSEELPDELAQLPFFRRRRARKAWRSARRDARAQWVKRERKKVPTPIGIPIIALLLAGTVAAASWLWPDQNGNTGRAKPHSTHHVPPAHTTPTPAPAPSSSDKRPSTANGVAKAFATGYTTRNLARDASHGAAVSRAAPYASHGLVSNLRRHDDRDWNKLVAAQAMTAAPSKVTVTAAPSKEELPPDTAVRVYRTVTVRIDVKGVDDYRYTRHLGVEVSRADTDQPWQVTRVLGIQE